MDVHRSLHYWLFLVFTSNCFSYIGFYEKKTSWYSYKHGNGKQTAHIRKGSWYREQRIRFGGYCQTVSILETILMLLSIIVSAQLFVNYGILRSIIYYICVDSSYRFFLLSRSVSSILFIWKLPQHFHLQFLYFFIASRGDFK